MTPKDPTGGRVLPLYVFFTLSGAAGLVYELVWTRYLALFVGSDAYAQVLVIAIFLGGMALGALAVGQRSERVRRPLLWYAGVEAILGLLGLLFHVVFVGVQGFAYETLFPVLGPGMQTVVVRWVLAALMILPQSILLGTTFPLMTAGVIRGAREEEGRRLATLYFVNSLGAAAGVVTAGFFLVARFGLPGTLVAGAVLNFAAAGGVWAVARGRAPARPAQAASPGGGDPSAAEAGGAVADETLWRLLLGTSFLTAVASFIYEIDWIRMLSLVMGSATHSFEIMLSAFILGLALGALLIRRHADRIARPVRVLGWIQWFMGLSALATLPLYLASFDVMAWMVNHLPSTDAGYLRFGLYRYLIAVAIMLPSTILAGMTLPLITKTLLARGAGERAIGWVYGVNTLGSIAGVVLAGLVLLPVLGIEGLLVAGAALDMAVGVVLLRRGEGSKAAETPRWRARALPLGLAGATVLVAAIGSQIHFDRSVLSSGVFRYGEVSEQDEEPVLYYADGRTATVSAYLHPPTELVLLATNGKPDASLTRRWIRAARGEPVPREPVTQGDEATQLLSALLPLAHRPDARSAAVVGHGSGLTAHYLLASPRLERVTTIEIEPRMVDGSQVYFPANRRTFLDGRSRIVIDDAKAYFAAQRDRYDLIVSEPSNPWVTGTASLFTEEFYRRVRPVMAPGGLFVQWIQLYEIDDELVTTVLAAIERVFPDYRAYVVGGTDLLVVATVGDVLPPADWAALDGLALEEDLGHVPELTPGYFRSTTAFGADAAEPLLTGWRPVNSDYRPVLEQRAERLRFLDRFATGLYETATDRFDVAAALTGRPRPVSGFTPVPVWASESMRIRGLGAWLREAIRGTEAEVDSALADPPRDEWSYYGDHVARVLDALEAREGPSEWIGWLNAMVEAERYLHARTAGYADSVFYDRVFDHLEATDAPAGVRASMRFLHGLAAFDFEEAAAASRTILASGQLTQQWPDPELLLDGAVVARLRTGDPEGADAAYDRLVRISGRSHRDFRNWLLEAWIERGSGR